MNIYTIYQPYTYLIKWSSTGMKYYGVRYAKGCNPEEFWVSYFTSSDFVNQYVEKHGDPDVRIIRKKFNNPDQARLWESKVLKRLKVANRIDFLNKNEGSLHVNWKDPEIKEKHRKGLIKAMNTPETRARNSAAQKIAQNRPEQKEKISMSSKKLWADSEHAENMSVKHKALWEDEEYRDKQTKARKEAANRPEVRAANSVRNSGSGNSRYDHSVYHFIHENGNEEKCTRYELQVKYNFPSNSGMCLMLKDQRESTYGWRLVKS
jgi:hypothetical protein